ncbi:DinB family protein [soil metagenome]
MQAKDVIASTLDTSEMIVNTYLADLDDADLLVRPVEGMNHIAWQLGHLIGSERHFVELIRPGSCPALPEGFGTAHGREAVTSDDPAQYLSRSRYQEIWKAQREATRSVLEGLTDADLDRADPSFPPFAPTVGALLNMCGGHPLMHAGQFVAVRRKLGKPVTI